MDPQTPNVRTLTGGGRRRGKGVRKKTERKKGRPPPGKHVWGTGKRRKLGRLEPRRPAQEHVFHSLEKGHCAERGPQGDATPRRAEHRWEVDAGGGEQRLLEAGKESDHNSTEAETTRFLALHAAGTLFLKLHSHGGAGGRFRVREGEETLDSHLISVADSNHEHPDVPTTSCRRSFSPDGGGQLFLNVSRRK